MARNRNFSTRLTDGERKALDELAAQTGATVADVFRGMMLSRPMTMALCDFATLTAGGVPAQLGAVVGEVLALGLRAVMIGSAPRLHPTDLDGLAPDAMATTFVRRLAAIRVTLAELVAVGEHKPVVGGDVLQPWRLVETDTPGFWRLERRPATDEQFASWLKNECSFNVGELTPIQATALRAKFEGERDLLAARVAIGDTPC